MLDYMTTDIFDWACLKMNGDLTVIHPELEMQLDIWI